MRTQYIYTLTLIPRLLKGEKWTEIDNLIVNEHLNYHKKLLDEGILILSGRTLNDDDSKFGLVIIEANSYAIARFIMLEDPAVKKGIMKAKLYPYRIALMQ